MTEGFREATVRVHVLGDSVGVQIHTRDVRWRDVKVKVSGVHAHNERARGAEHVGQGQRAQRDVRARPVEREDHLQRTIAKPQIWKLSGFSLRTSKVLSLLKKRFPEVN